MQSLYKPMNKRLITTALTGIFASAIFTGNAVAAEVPHGTWTTNYQKIEQVDSFWNYTRFKIAEASGCGDNGDHYWLLATTRNDAALDKVLDFKRSLLLTAFATQQKVLLRCEGGRISDLMVKSE